MVVASVFRSTKKIQRSFDWWKTEQQFFGRKFVTSNWYRISSTGVPRALPFTPTFTRACFRKWMRIALARPANTLLRPAPTTWSHIKFGFKSVPNGDAAHPQLYPFTENTPVSSLDFALQYLPTLKWAARFFSFNACWRNMSFSLLERGSAL